jgi:DNA-binding NarL/FixJ family response regulator
MGGAMIDVVVAEPNPLLRIGIRSVLEEHADIAVTDEVEDGECLLALIRQRRHDVVLIGLGLLRHVGVAAFRELRHGGATHRVLVHSYEWDSTFASEACRFGALGYVSHECTQSELSTAVRDVAEGRPFITRQLGVVLAEAACFRGTVFARAALSARERQVSRMVAIGLDVRAIAAQLGIGVHEAAACKWRIARKVDQTEMGDLVRHAIRQASRDWSRSAARGVWPSDPRAGSASMGSGGCQVCDEARASPPGPAAGVAEVIPEHGPCRHEAQLLFECTPRGAHDAALDRVEQGGGPGVRSGG